MSKILCTGGAGLIGSHLVDELLLAKHEVTVVDDYSGSTIKNLGRISQRQNLTVVEGDVRDVELVNKLVPGHDYIYHLAAYAAEGQSFFSPAAINDINIKPMNNLLVAAVNNNIKRFIFTSSMAVYGDQKPPFNETLEKKPVDPYGLAKAYCEDMLHIFSKIYNLEYTIVRPHNVFGERQNIADPYRNVIGIWMNMMMRGKRPIIYGDGQQVRAFSFVRNVSLPLARAMDCEPNRIINLGGSKEYTINEMYKLVAEAMGFDKMPMNFPDRPGEVKNAFCTSALSRELLSYRDNWTVESGVLKMAEWVKEQGPQDPSYRIPLEITKNAPESWRDRLI